MLDGFYLLLLFIPGGKGRCRIYIHISLPYSFQDVPRTEHVHYMALRVGSQVEAKVKELLNLSVD